MMNNLRIAENIIQDFSLNNELYTEVNSHNKFKIINNDNNTVYSKDKLIKASVIINFNSNKNNVVFLGRNLSGTVNITITENNALCYIGDDCNFKKLQIAQNQQFDFIAIGNHVTTNFDCAFRSGLRATKESFTTYENSTGIIIGDDCMFSSNCVIRSSDSHPIIEYASLKPLNESTKSVVIEEHVWIAENAKILKNTTVGANSILALGTVVTKDVPKYSVAKGNPMNISSLKGRIWQRAFSKKSENMSLRFYKKYLHIDESCNLYKPNEKQNMKNISRINSSSNFKIILKESSKKLIIFFSGTDKKDGFFDFYKVGQNVDANVILVNNGINAWYQNGIPDMGGSLESSISFLLNLKKELGIEEVFTSGVSMGGYGAVLFAARLNCNCLAFSCDTVLKLACSRSLSRMPKRVKLVVPDLLPEIKKSKGFFHIYAGEIDTMDLVGATYVQELPNVQVKLLRGVGHGAAVYIEHEFGLVPFINLFLEGKVLPTSKFESPTCKNLDVVENLWKSSIFFSQMNYVESLKYAIEAQKIAPKLEAVNYRLGLIYEKQERFYEAYEEFSMVAIRVPHLIGAHHKLAVSLRKLGDDEGAINVYKNFLELKPTSGTAMFWLSKLYYKNNNIRESYRYITKAIKNSPDNKTIQNFYDVMLKREADELELEKYFNVINDNPLNNNLSGTAHGIIWFEQWKKEIDDFKATHIQICVVNKSIKFKGISSEIDVGIYEVNNITYDKRKKSYKLTFLNDKELFSGSIGRDSLLFKLLIKK